MQPTQRTPQYVAAITIGFASHSFQTEMFLVLLNWPRIVAVYQVQPDLNLTGKFARASLGESGDWPLDADQLLQA